MQCLPALEHYVGIDFFPRNARLLRRLAPPRLRIDYVRGPSCSAQVLDRVRQLLCGRPIDLLFIDGDHAYAAVKRDWETYRQWVRPGAWVAFHDIQTPELTADGGYANGFEVAVHRLWNEVKSLGATREFVARDEKPGYGIGVLQIDGGVGGGHAT